jgi:hypothetical protein
MGSIRLVFDGDNKVIDGCRKSDQSVVHSVEHLKIGRGAAMFCEEVFDFVFSGGDGRGC